MKNWRKKTGKIRLDIKRIWTANRKEKKLRKPTGLSAHQWWPLCTGRGEAGRNCRRGCSRPGRWWSARWSSSRRRPGSSRWAPGPCRWRQGSAWRAWSTLAASASGATAECGKPVKQTSEQKENRDQLLRMVNTATRADWLQERQRQLHQLNVESLQNKQANKKRVEINCRGWRTLPREQTG